MAVSGRDDADVGGDGPGFPHPLKLLGLQDPQELYLDGRGDVADFVQKDIAPVGRLEAALAMGVGPGEGALDVAEELAFQQGFVEGGAIAGDEGAPRRRPRAWMAWATSSLPVPLSPKMITGASLWAAFWVRSKTCCMRGDLPTMP